MSPANPDRRHMAERICEAAADRAGILDAPVLMSPTPRFSSAKHVAAGAMRALGYTYASIAIYLGYSEVPTAVGACNKADPSDVAAVLHAVEVRR